MKFKDFLKLTWRLLLKLTFCLILLPIHGFLLGILYMLRPKAFAARLLEIGLQYGIKYLSPESREKIIRKHVQITKAGRIGVS
jgi:hypothetical protein